MPNESDSPEPLAPKRRRGCLFYAFCLFVGVPLLMVVGVVVTFVARENSARSEVNARVARLAAAGFPVDNTSMQSYFEGLTSTEDTQRWTQLLDTIEDRPPEDFAGVPIFDGNTSEIVPSPGEEWEAEQRTREFLSMLEDAASQLEEIALRQLAPESKPVRFPIEFQSIETLLPYTQKMRSAGRLHLLRGKLAVYDRDSETTRRSVESLLGTAKALYGEPILVSQLVALAIDQMAVDLIRQALYEDVLNDSDLQTIQELLESDLGVGPTWRIAMTGERAMMLPVFADPGKAMAGNGPPTIPFRARDTLHYLDHMDRVFEIKSDDFDEFLSALKAEEAKLTKLQSGNVLQKLDSVLTSMLTPAVSAGGSAFVRRASLRRLAVLAIGVRQYQHEFDELPADLESLEQVSLEPQALTPPGGKPFGFQPTESGVVIWGFDVSRESVTPDEPPTSDGMYGEWNKQWVWELPNVTAQGSPTVESDSQTPDIP